MKKITSIVGVDCKIGRNDGKKGCDNCMACEARKMMREISKRQEMKSFLMNNPASSFYREG